MKTLIQMIMAADQSLNYVHNTVVDLKFRLILKDSAVLISFIVLGLICNSLDTVIYHVTVWHMNLSNQTVFNAFCHLDYVCETARTFLLDEIHEAI